MKTIGLLLRKDLRLHRLSVAVWIAVLVAEVLFALSGLDTRMLDHGGFRPWDVGATALNIAHLALLFVVLVGAVQADAPTSPTAFWTTRPIGRWPLLGSKLVFALVVVAVPWLVANVVILIGRGIALGALARSLPELWLVQAMVILPALVIGGLTSQLPRALLGLVGLIALVWTGSMLMLMSPLPALAERAFEPGRGATADAVAGLVTMAMAAATLATTYRRRAREATLLVVAAVPLGVGALFLWPWSFKQPLLPPLPATVSVTVGNTARNGTAWVRRRGARDGAPAVGTPRPGSRQLYRVGESAGEWAKWPVVGEAVVSGLPEDLRAWPVRVDSNVRSDSGSEEDLVIEPRAVDSSLGAETSVVITGLGRVTAVSASRTAWMAARDPRAQDEAAGAVVSATARFRLVVVRERVAARLPLQVGAHWDGPSDHVVLRAAAIDDTAALDIVESRLRQREVEPAGTASARSTGGWDGPGSGYYALYNPARQELLRFGIAYPYPMGIPFAASGLHVNRLHLELTWPEAERWHSRATRRDWLREAELIKIDVELVAAGERTLEVKDLPLPARSE